MRFKNCTSINSRSGFAVATWGLTEIIDCSAEGSHNTSLSHSGNTYVRGGRFSGSNAIGFGSQASHTLDISDALFVLEDRSAPLYQLWDIGGAQFTGRNLSFDFSRYTEATNGTLQLFKLSATSGSINISGLNITGKSSSTMGPMIYADSGFTANNVARIVGVDYVGSFDYNAATPGNRFNITSNCPNAQVGGNKTVAGANANTKYVSATVAASAVIPLSRIPDDNISVLLNGTNGTGVITFGALDTVGRRNGDQIVVRNEATGTGSVSLNGVSIAAGGGVARFTFIENAWKAA